MSLESPNTRVEIPTELRRLHIPAPFLSGIRNCSKVVIQNEEDGSISEMRVEDFWFPARGLSKKQRSKNAKEGISTCKLYAPIYNKNSGDVYYEYVSETQDYELAEKMVDDAWGVFNAEQERREKELEIWLRKNQLTLLNSAYACTN